MMHRTKPVLLGVLLLAAGVWAEEGQAVSLVPAQLVRPGEVTATGRIVPQFSVRIGSRLPAHIVDWGKNEGGELLDVGMSVKAGQKLFSIDPRTFEARVNAAQASLASTGAALENLKAPTRKERIDVLRTALAELDARLKDRERDEARYRRLVEVDRAMPAKSLEDAQLELELVRAQRQAAQARLDEALAGPTKTEIAVAEARVNEAQALLAAAQLDLRDTVVAAPFDAVITKRMKGLGDYVGSSPLVEVLELTTTDHLEVELRLPEAYFGKVIPGTTPLALHSPLLKADRALTVTRVIPDIDVQLGTFALRVAIPPAQRDGLAPGAFVTATLKLGDQAGDVVVPQRAVLVDGHETYVLVAADGKMARRKVELGDRLTEGVVVKSGIRPGESVVIGPADQLKDGAPLPGYLVQEKR